MRILSTSLDVGSDRDWAVSEIVRWLRLVPCYFHLLDSIYRIPESIRLVSNRLTFLHRHYSHKLLQSYIFCSYSYCRQTITSIFPCLPVFSLWFFASAVIYGKLYGFSISLVTLICRVEFPLESWLWTTQTISLPTCNFVLFWYILH